MTVSQYPNPAIVPRAEQASPDHRGRSVVIIVDRWACYLTQEQALTLHQSLSEALHTGGDA